MKKNKLISLLIILLIFATFSCNDEFDKMPSDSLPSTDATPNLATLNTAINGVYSTLVDRWGYAGDIGLYADAKGGDLHMVSRSFNHLQPILLFQTDKTSGASIGAYKVFGYLTKRANSLMESAKKVSDKESNKNLYNDYIGQLYFLRALGHFEMSRVFAQLPSVAPDINTENSGIALNDKIYPSGYKFTRSSIKQTYDFIISDLEQALKLLSKEKKEASGKANYWTAEALLSRVYLYLQDYDNALKHASNVIKDGPYKLYTIEEYLTVWNKTGTNESLFEVRTTDKSNAQRNSIGYYTNPDGYPEAAASDIFLSFIKDRKDDIRSKTIIEKVSTKGKHKSFYTIKYDGQEGVTAPLYVNNFKVIRLSEVYLIAAEAKLLGGKAEGAKKAVWYYNALRKNRIKSYADVGSVNIKDLLDERRIELFCENQRMYDLVRLKQTIISEEIGETLNYNDYRILTAIPQREINISPDLKQNPNW